MRVLKKDDFSLSRFSEEITTFLKKGLIPIQKKWNSIFEIEKKNS